MPVVEIVCPDGAGEGMMIDVNLGDAGVVQVEVPAGVGPGMPFNIEIADPPPAEGDGSTMETKFEGVGNVDYEKEDVDAEVLAALNGESGVTYSGYNKNVGGNRHNEWIKSLQPGMPGLVLRSDGSLSYGTVISADDTIITWDIGGVEKTTDDNGCAPRRPRARPATTTALRTRSDLAPAFRRLRAHCVIRVYRSFFTWLYSERISMSQHAEDGTTQPMPSRCDASRLSAPTHAPRPPALSYTRQSPSVHARVLQRQRGSAARALMCTSPMKSRVRGAPITVETYRIRSVAAFDPISESRSDPISVASAAATVLNASASAAARYPTPVASAAPSTRTMSASAAATYSAVVARTTRVSASIRMVLRRCAVVIFSTMASSTCEEGGEGRKP